MGRTISMAQLRRTPNVGSLAVLIEKAEPAKSCSQVSEDPNREFSTWFSPGQYSPMGAWVLRSDVAIDFPALRSALVQVIDRHPTMRAKILDPLHYMSVIYDAAVLWSLVNPFIEIRRYRIMLALKRLISWAFRRTWPRVRSCSREHIYKERFPEHSVPLEVLTVDSNEGEPFKGQRQLERELKRLKGMLRPPFCLTVYELKCYLVDVWHYDEPPKNAQPHLTGRFSIIRRPAWVPDPDDAENVYIDVATGEYGPLLGPLSSRWQTPPYGFPALFFVPLSSGAVLWIRIEEVWELRICYKKAGSREAYNFHYTSQRAAPHTYQSRGEANTVYFLSLCMVHAFGDGNCYMPLAQDLFSFYDAARKGSPITLPSLPNPLEALERRLFSTLTGDFSPLRSSLRGAMYWYRGSGYGYCTCIEPGAVAALTLASARYHIPLDVILLGLVVCSLARADQAHGIQGDLIDFTLYSPMRDGPAEAMMMGLFADWRDLAVGVDIDSATVLGTMLQLLHAIQHRHWTPFNALRKPERTIVNIQPLDMEHRSHFSHLGENLWHGGDVLGNQVLRGPETDPGRQPLTFNIEQQDQTTWWILVDIGHNERPTAWTRSFLVSLREAFNDLLFNPFQRVHRPVPEVEWQKWLAWERSQKLSPWPETGP